MSKDIIKRLVEAGTPADLIADVACALAEVSVLEQRRSSERKRKAKQRERDKECHVTSRDVTGQDEQKEKIPQTPLKEKLPPSPKGDTPKSPKAERLPNDFDMPEPWKAWAASERGWQRPEVETEAANFADYWQAKGGANARRVDWRKTWQNWVRNSRRDSARSVPQSQPAWKGLRVANGP